MTDDLVLPPGFRFHPTDEELVMDYLGPKCALQQIAVPIIAEIDLYKFNPWDLPGLALYGEKEWYFFSYRDRKYPNGSRPNRTAGCGYWKATGADKLIGHPKAVGIKKALVFYKGKAPKGEKTNWIMHEYRLADVDRSACKKGNNLKLDGVLCRIYNKKGLLETLNAVSKAEKIDDSYEIYEQKPDVCGTEYVPPHRPVVNELAHKSDSVLNFHTDSNCSEQVVSPEFNCKVQSEITPDIAYNYLDATMEDDFFSPFQSNNQLLPMQDMFMYFQQPF